MFFSDSHPFAALGGFAFIMFFLIVWSMVWKAWALWRSARLGSKGWFAVFLFVNTVGILELIYLFAISKPVAPVVPEVKKKD